MALACGLLCSSRMTRRHFAPAPKSSLSQLLGAERLPLDLALSLAVEVIDAVATSHQQRRAFGRLSVADFVVEADGSLRITATSVPGADPASDTFDVGAVLYQLFTGLSPKEARARLQLSPLHEVPLASRINPALDDSIEALLQTMLERDPALRPHSLRVVEAMLADVCELLDLESSRAAIVGWAHPPVRAKRHVPTFVVADVDVVEVDDEEDGESSDDAPAPLRFDLWAVAACAFSVFAFTLATKL